MKRLITIYISLLFTFSYSNAQELGLQDNYTIGILPITVADYSSNSHKEAIYGIISKVFTGKSRFTVVDRAKLDQVARERNLQKQEDFIDGYIVEQGKSLGAQYLVSCNIIQISSSSNKEKRKKTRSVKDPNTGKYVSEDYYVDMYVFQSSVKLNMQVIEVATGSVKSSKIITSSKTYETQTPKNGDEESVINSAVSETEGYLKAWANEVFPVEMKVMKVESLNKKGMPEKILIKGGADMDLQHSGWLINTSSDLEVYENEIIPMDGKEYTRKVPIGKVTIAETQGEFSVCKVKSGGETIQKKLNEGKTLYLRILNY